MNQGPLPVDLVRVDPRLLDLVGSLFWATFPRRRLLRTGPDADGRVALAVDPPWTDTDERRWRAALDDVLVQPSVARAAGHLRRVEDRAGRRWELALPMAPDAYAAGAWLVGPFVDAAAADAWAATRLVRPWVHDVVDHAGATFADVFLGDPDA